MHGYFSEVLKVRLQDYLLRTYKLGSKLEEREGSRDHHPALYEAIAGLLQNRILRQSMSDKARRYMEQCSFDQAFQETWRMYETNPAHPVCVPSKAV